ncbi:MAG: peptidoglycan-binding protein [Bacteroidota bacterium]
MPAEYEVEEEEYIVYTGEKSAEAVGFERVSIEVSPEGTQWVKKATMSNCNSPNPEKDCLVWCLEEVPSEKVELKVLKDPSQTSDYKVVKIQKKILTSKGGFSVWREVLCNAAITSDLVRQVRKSLRTYGYYNQNDPSHLAMDGATKDALIAFQKGNQIPFGNLDKETITMLGINFDQY